MDADTLKKKLQKQNPLMMSPMAFALAACGGGGGEVESEGDDNISAPEIDPPKIFYQVQSTLIETEGAFDIDGNFHNPSDLKIDSADFNNDGHSDLVVAQVGHLANYEKAYDPIILFSRGFLKFDIVPVVSDWDGILHPSKLIIHDLDVDGDLDVLASANGYDAPPFPNENFAIFIQHNNLLYQSPSFEDLNENYPTNFDSTRGDGRGGFYHTAAAGDVNGDGVPEIFMGDMRKPFIINGHTKELINLTELMDPLDGGNQVLSAEIRDVVGDPSMELILGGHSFTPRIIEFDVSLKIQNVTELPSVEQLDYDKVLGITSGDINGDGLSDIIFSLANVDYSHGSIQVLIQTSDGLFLDNTNIWFEDLPEFEYWTKEISLIDLEGDGDLDLILGQTEPSKLTYYENDNETNYVKRTIEDPLDGWQRFNVGIDEANTNVFLVNKSAGDDYLIVGLVDFIY